MRDLVSDLGAAQMIVPAVLAADNTPLVVDLAGFDSCAIALSIGIGGITFTGSNKIEFILKHGDASDGSDQAAVAQTDVIGVTLTGSGIVRSLIALKSAADVQKFGYKGTKRYISLLADFSGTHATGTATSAVALRGAPVSGPVA